MQLKIDKAVLSNGLKVIVNEDPTSPICSALLAYLAGNRTEREGISGISHVLEHLMYKGTDRVGPEEYSQTIQRLGGYDNAFTSKDYTIYYTYLPIHALETFLSLESDRMVNLKIKDFKEEMRVILDERRLTSVDNPIEHFLEELWMKVFKVHPYRFPVIGLEKDLKRIKVDDVMSYYNTYYTPSNAILVVAGKVEAEKVFELAENYFGKIEKDNTFIDFPPRELDRENKEHFVLKRKGAPRVVTLTFRSVSMASPLAVVFEVLEQMLCGGKWGILTKHLVYEENVFSSITCDSTFLLDDGVFTIVGIPNEGMDVFKSSEILEKAVFEAKDKFNEELLDTSKSKILADFYFDVESVRDVIFHLLDFELIGGAEKINEYPDWVRKVSLQNVTEVFTNFFVEQREILGILHG